MEKDDQMNLEDIKSKCLDSEGYLMFSAYITPKKDPQGRAIIEFQYRRYQFSLEDSKQALIKLSKFIKDELDNLTQLHPIEPGENESDN